MILQTVSRETIAAALAESDFGDRLHAIRKRDEMSYRADAWFQKKHFCATPMTVAYFSMEFMLSEALPIYSGGLGQVAGDQMKAASDLGVPGSRLTSSSGGKSALLAMVPLPRQMS